MNPTLRRHLIAVASFADPESDRWDRVGRSMAEMAEGLAALGRASRRARDAAESFAGAYPIHKRRRP